MGRKGKCIWVLAIVLWKQLLLALGRNSIYKRGVKYKRSHRGNSLSPLRRAVWEHRHGNSGFSWQDAEEHHFSLMLRLWVSCLSPFLLLIYQVGQHLFFSLKFIAAGKHEGSLPCSLEPNMRALLYNLSFGAKVNWGSWPFGEPAKRHSPNVVYLFKVCS